MENETYKITLHFSILRLYNKRHNNNLVFIFLFFLSFQPNTHDRKYKFFNM